MHNLHTILIIDDDTDDIELFIDAIKQIDAFIHCESALNGREGLQKLDEKITSLPDYIFLDLNMPRMNGKECLNLLKKDARYAHIPVIIYTTSKSEADIEETARMGAAAFITKPVRLDDLKKSIAEIFKKFKV